MARLKSPQQLEAERQEARRYLRGTYMLPIDRLLLIYARQSSKFQVINNKQAALQQTEDLILRGLDLEWKREQMLLFVENYFTKDGKRTSAIRSVSGSIPIEDRPGLRTIVDEYVKKGLAGAIICYDVSRLTRDADLVDAMLLAKACKDARVVIITNDTVYDFNNPKQNDLERFIDEAKVAAAFVEKHIKGKVLAARTRKAEKDGLLANGRAPIGLMTDKKPGYRVSNNLLPSLHAPYVNALYEGFLALNASVALLYREVAGKVVFPDVPGIDPNSIHLRHIEGGWTISSRKGLKHILTNPMYDGHLVFNGKIVKRNAHPAIVEHAVWQYVFDILADTDIEGNPIERGPKVVRFNQRGNNTDALLAGVRHDGRPVIEGTGNYGVYVYVPTNSSKKNAYCIKLGGHGEMDTYTAGIDVPTLDKLFEERLMVRLDLQAEIEQRNSQKFSGQAHEYIHGYSVVTAFKELGEESTPPKTGYEDAINETREALTWVTRQIDIGGRHMSDKELDEKYASKANLRRRLADLEARHDKANRARAELEQAKEDCRTARCQWGSWDSERKRRLIRLVTNSITLEQVSAGWLSLTVVWTPYLGTDIDVAETALIWQRAGNRWTDEEIDVLKAHYSTDTRGELLGLLPARSWVAIRTKGAAEGLARPWTSVDTDLPEDMSLTDRAMIEQHELCMNDPGKRVWWLSPVNLGCEPLN
jgi:DNA invertase Pin-like site-specific DNA recombinase